MLPVGYICKILYFDILFIRSCYGISLVGFWAGGLLGGLFGASASSTGGKAQNGANSADEG
jgi:hypothetical protein